MCAHLNACTSLYVSMPVLLHACKRFWVCVCTPTRFRVHVQACVFVLLWSCVHVHACLNMRGDPKMQFIYKKLCIYSYTFKLQSPSKYSSFDAIHLLRRFFHCSDSFWTHWFLCLLVLLPFFVSLLPHQQNVSIWGHFSSGKQKKVPWGMMGK